MVYENNLDERLFGEEIEIGRFVLKVEVYKYRDNKPKIQISRMKEDKHLKVGRLTIDEVDALLPLLTKAKTKFEPKLVTNDPPKEEEIKQPIQKEETKIDPVKTMTKKKPELKKKEEVSEDIKSLPEFKIVLVNHTDLRDNMYVIKNLIYEAMINITEDKLSLLEMDPANVSMTKFELFNEKKGNIWDVSKEGKFKVNATEFYKLLNNAKSNDIVTLNDKDDTSIEITISGKTVRTYTLPLLEYEDYKPQKEPGLNFEAKVTMPSRLFAKEIIQIKKKCDKAEFVATDKACFCLKGYKGDKTLIELPNDHETGDIEVITRRDKDICSKYSIDYLHSMTKRVPISFHNKVNKVKIQYSEDYPFKITYFCPDKFNMEFILAPRVEND